MAVKWFEQVNLIQHEAMATRNKTESLLAELTERARRRREQQEAEARERGESRERLVSNWLEAQQRARAADDLEEAGIPVSEATVGQQIRSGGTWAQVFQRQAEEEAKQDRLNEIYKEAELWAKWNIKQEGESWANLNPDDQKAAIDKENEKLLRQYFPEEYGEPEVMPEPTIPEVTQRVQIPPEGLYIAEGIKVMPDYNVYSDDDLSKPIGKINPETGEFKEAKVGAGQWLRNALSQIWKGIPFNPYYWMSPEQQRLADYKKQLVQFAKNQNIPNPEEWVNNLMEQPTGEVTIGPQPEGAEYKKLPPLPSIEGYLPQAVGAMGERLTKGEQFIGEWVMPMVTLALLPSAGAVRGALQVPAKAGGIVGKAAQVGRVALKPVELYEQGINALMKLPAKALTTGAQKVLNTYITNNAKYISTIARRDPASLNLKEGILYKLFSFHNRYMTTQADAILKAQLAAKKGVGVAAEATQKQIMLLNAGIESSTQTMSNIVAAAQAGQELTTTSITGLIAKNTPKEFITGITDIITGKVIAEVGGIVPPVTPTPAMPEVTRVTAEGIRIPKTAQEIEQLFKAGRLVRATEEEVDVVLMKSLEPQVYEEYHRLLAARETDKVSVEQIAAWFDKEAQSLYKQGWAYNIQEKAWYRPLALAEAGMPEAGLQAETTALAEAETITGAIPEGEVEVVGMETPAMSVAEVKRIRQSIVAASKIKGLSQTALNKLFKEVAGRSPDDRQLPYRLTEMTDEQLRDTLEIVKTARPVKIGTKNVIKPSTEKKIEALKAWLIKEAKLSDEAFNNIVNELGLPTTKYETAQKFITEKQGKALIRRMNDEAELGFIERQAKVTKALENNPTIKQAYDDYTKRIAKEGKAYFQGKPADASMLKDQRFAMEDLQVRTGKLFYGTYFALNRAKNANYQYLAEAKERIVASTLEYNKLVNDKKSMQRIRDYIAAKNAWAKVESPKDITPEEIKLANAYEEELLTLQPDFRYHRFLQQYHAYEGDVAKMQEHIPDAPKEELRTAVNIYERQGATGLKAYLDTKTWGIIESGYEPHYAVNPSLAMRRLKAAFPTGRLEPRSGVQFYSEDVTIDKAVDRYIRQLKSYNLQPYVRKMGRLYSESIPQLKNPYKINRGISTMLNEMLGYKDRTFIGELILKGASQAYITVFGTFINLPFRNLFQNLAFHPDKGALIDPRNRKLTDWERGFYDIHASQMKGVNKDLLLSEEAGLPGLRRINRFILRLNLYGASDSKVNRVWSLWASVNKAERALNQFKKDGDIQKFISHSGMAELTLTQQKQILENLVMDEVTIPGLEPTSGGEAAITEIANEITNNVHFLYERSQRAWIEMGEAGRIIGSLVIFPRSMIQRIVVQGKVLDPKGWSPQPKKKAALKALLGMGFGSLAANYLYQKATGRKDAPYNPFNILKWTPGGLTFGAVSSVAELSGLLFMAITGNDWAKGELPAALAKAGDTFVPFYQTALNCLESAFDKKYIDRKLWRELRSIIEEQMVEMGFLDKAYQPNVNYYEAERSWEWKIKHALFGIEPDEEAAKSNALRDSIAQIRYERDWADLTKDEKETIYSDYPNLR